jgi:hypothetical protein
MRTFWHDAGSAAMTLALKKAVPLSARTQLLISRFMSGSSAGRYCGFRHLCVPVMPSYAAKAL